MNDQLKQSFHTISMLYGSMSFFLTIIHNVFLLYHIDMFVSVYKIDKLSFWIGEVVFLIWNSINDPLFGWLSDRRLLSTDQSQKYHKDNTQSFDVIMTRLNNLSKMAPLFAISFFLFWIPWLPPAIQFASCLCLYDGFLTCVDLQHTALLADLAIFAQDRSKLNRKTSLFSTFGTISVFLSYVYWNQKNIFPFQVFCCIIAVISTVGFIVSTQLLVKLFKRISKLEKKSSLTVFRPTTDKSEEKSLDLKTYLKQLSTNHNFRWFVSMNLVQVFHCHFNSNFFPLFLDALVGDAIAPGVGPMLIGISFVLPHLNNLYFLNLCDKHGVYNVIRWLFYTKLVLALIMLSTGHGSVWLLCLFIASNRIFTEGTCKLLNLVISDLVDEDYVRHNREHAASAVLFGMSSLLSKPGQTFAPLIGTWLLAFYTGEDIFQTKKDVSLRDFIGWPAAKMSRRDACFFLLVSVPIVCALLQLVAWSRFTLHGARLNQIKSIRLSKTTDVV